MPAESTAPSGAQLADPIIRLLSRPPQVEGIALDTSYFAAADNAATRSGSARVLLPGGYSWHSPSPGAAEPGTAEKARVPLQLCEFLAYKTALAYESEDRIREYLKQCCGIPEFKFFNSARNKENTPGVAADAQGYGFIFERRAYVIFRGTASKNDWRINRIDTLTSELDGATDRRYLKLRRKYGHLLDKLGDPKPGRHVGFSIAWAALKDEVEDWLAKALEERSIDQIVYSGHSLGGAMAQIAAFDHARIADAVGKDRNIKVDHIAAVVTFGAPAVGGDAFALKYAELLGMRTVLLESSGDLVPRIMQRWYYRMLYPLRQRIKAGIQAHLDDKGGFNKVVSPWSFASEPPLSNSDIDSAIISIRSAGERALKDVAERAKKQAEEEKKNADERAAEAAKRSGSAEPGVTQPSTDNSKDVSARKAGTSSSGTGTSPKSDSDNPSIVYWVVVGVVVIAAAGIAWYFVRRKLFSHDIEQRYALYLSTLSYQQLRAKHGGNIDLANKELEDHLAFVRGDFSKAADIAIKHADEEGKYPPLFGSVQGLPVPVTIRKDPEFIEYLNRKDTFL